MSACCAPSTGGALPHRQPTDVRPGVAAPPRRNHPPVLDGMTLVPGGPFRMGGEDADAFPADGEGPVRQVEVAAFHIDATAVTNAQFAEFAEATGHVTEAERYGWSFVFHAFVSRAGRRHVMGSTPQAPWWLGVGGASWRAPEGPGSGVQDRQDHPVVHVSWHDASAYAGWARKRLPTEAEWEKAARGGLDQARFPWGDEFMPGDVHQCNTWQGSFPTHDRGDDGHTGTAPVDAFAPNGLGLYNTSGNVWEWCADWWSATWHARARHETRVDPRCPAAGDARVMRGGSHLCHSSYCNRYRVAARTASPSDSSTGHTGFRCAADAASARPEGRPDCD